MDLDRTAVKTIFIKSAVTRTLKEVIMLENMLKPDWLENRPRFAFIIGLVYAILAILAAYWIFPKSQGIASIAFLSVLLVPSLNNILKIEEIQDTHERFFSIRRAFRDHSDVLEIYFLLFLGIFFAYALLSVRFPSILVSGIFDNQLRVIGVTGGATLTSGFWSIVANNLKVIFIFLVLSLVLGAGSIMFLAWNASVWGIAFAYMATHWGNAFNNFSSIFVRVMPHMLLEAGAYFFAIIAGGIMSQAILREKIGSKKFNYVLKDGMLFLLCGLVLLILGALVEVYVFPVL